MALTFLSLVLSQFFKAYNFRSDRQSILHRPFASKWLNIAALWDLLVLNLIVYVSVLEKAFGTYSMPLADWLVVIGLAFTIVPVLELTKLLIRRFAPLKQVAELHSSTG